MLESLVLRDAGLNVNDLKKDRIEFIRQVTAELAMLAKKVLSEEDRRFVSNLAYKLRERLQFGAWKSSNKAKRQQNILFLKMFKSNDCVTLDKIAWKQEKMSDSDKQLIRSLVDCEGALGWKDASYARGLLEMQIVSDSEYTNCKRRMDALRREIEKVPSKFGSEDAWDWEKKQRWFLDWKSTAQDPSKLIQNIQTLVGSLPCTKYSPDAFGLQDAQMLVGSLPCLKDSLERVVGHAAAIYRRKQYLDSDYEDTYRDWDTDWKKKAVILRYQARHPAATEKALACSASPGTPYLP